MTADRLLGHDLSRNGNDDRFIYQEGTRAGGHTGPLVRPSLSLHWPSFFCHALAQPAFAELALAQAGGGGRRRKSRARTRAWYSLKNGVPDHLTRSLMLRFVIAKFGVFSSSAACGMRRVSGRGEVFQSTLPVWGATR